MAGHYTLTGDFQLISEEQGTLYNVGISDVELSSDATKGQGILLRSGETQAFKGTIYARSYDESGSLNVQNFIELPGGGDSGGGGGTPYTLPTMAQNVKGGAKLGAGLYTQDDALNLNFMGTRTLGGAMVGAGLHTDAGVLNLNMMGESVFGGAMVGAGLHTEGWSIVLNTMGASVKGGAMLGAGLHTDAGAVHLNEMGESVFGGAKLGAGLHTDDGALTLNVMGASVLGGAKLGTGLYTQDGALNLATMGESVNGGAMLGSGLYTQDGKLNLRQMSASVIGGAKLGKSMSIVTDRIEMIQYRKPSQSYSVGDIAFVNVSATKMQKLVCVKAGTTGSGDFSLPSGYAEGSIHDDGTVVWAVDFFAIIDNERPATTDAVNSIVRQADITAYFNSGLLSDNLSSGKYFNMYPGDFITKTVTFDGVTAPITVRIGEILQALHQESNTFLNALICFGRTVKNGYKMNETKITTGGFVGSKMYSETLPALLTALKDAFGSSHFANARQSLTNVIDESGKIVGFIQPYVEISLLSTAALGFPNFDLLNTDLVNYAGVNAGYSMILGRSDRKLACFNGLRPGRAIGWLRDTLRSGYFTIVNGWGEVQPVEAAGHPDFLTADNSNPCFCIWLV